MAISYCVYGSMSILLNHIYECTFQYNRVGVLGYFHLTIPVTKKNLSILMNIQKHVKMFITIFNKVLDGYLEKKSELFFYDDMPNPVLFIY